MKRVMIVKMSAEDRRQTGEQLGQAEIALMQAEADRAATRSEHNSAVKTARDRVRDLARQLEAGTVERAVELDWKMDFGAGLKRLIRLDTFEVIETQPLTLEEKQRSLFGDTLADVTAELAAESADGNPAQPSGDALRSAHEPGPVPSIGPDASDASGEPVCVSCGIGLGGFDVVSELGDGLACPECALKHPGKPGDDAVAGPGDAPPAEKKSRSRRKL